MHNNFLAVAFALLSAATMAAGTVWRHRIMRGGARQGEEAADSPLSSIKQWSWWASMGLAFLAYGFQATALAFGSLLVVQPVLALSLMLTLIFSAWAEHRHMTTPEAFWAIALTASVGGVVVLGHPGHGERTPPAWEWVTVVATAIGVVVGAFALASRRRASAKALIFGIACGAMFGYQAVFSKVAVDDFVAGGLTGLITSWQLWAMLVAATAGTLVQQYAFAAGNLATSLPASKIVEPIVAFSLGIAVLGETFGVQSAAGWVAVGTSISVMLVSAAMLTRVSVK